MQASKKQCTNNSTKKPAKSKPSTSKDPQSIAAKVNYFFFHRIRSQHDE